ncbi:MAG: hypothetical protein Q9178_003777 [Gyalolechia marmorata]
MASSNASLVTGCISLGLVVLLTLPAISIIVIKFNSRSTNGSEEIEKPYEDEDGSATEASSKSFSAALPIYLTLGSTVSGLGLSTATAIQSTARTRRTAYIDTWLALGCWILLSIQALVLSRERGPVKRFHNALASAASFLVLIVNLVCQNKCLQSCWSGWTSQVIFITLQLACASVSCLSCLMLPRRPCVYSNRQAVDNQFSVSILNRWTFTWAAELLAFARKNNGLDMEHLPRLQLRLRSNYLQKSFNEKKRHGVLWKDLLRVHRLELAGQSLLSMSQGVIQFTPQLAMYKLLELLEQRSKGSPIADEAWAWVIGLGIAIIVTAWLETQMHWVVWARMGSLIRSELSALIFSKSMRRKDARGHQKARTEGDIEANGATELVAHGIADQQQAQLGDPLLRPLDGDEDEEIQKSRQSVINLVAIDTKRISDFATCHWIFSQTVAKLIASIFFLSKLIGWPSLLAGFTFAALTLPFNIWASRTYSNTQTGLMKARDQKMVLVTEALQGIRQIKFSALESPWEVKIGKQRAVELAMQWRAFAADTALIGIWILGPVMLSAVSLAVFAILRGELSPSIAFTTITVFAQIEMTLAIIPGLTSDGLEAWVSLQRIGQYLDAPEKEAYSIPSEAVAFEGASIAWPSDSHEEDPDRFVLRNINLHFPAKELSVISGKTGSGKSLLLAAILEEADKIAGSIKVPRAPLQRYDHKANKSNWVIDAAVAFVAQIPWIENATIKDNILFELPFDKQRYDKVLSSCALTKDLEMLPDGELTEIGANGINLSGGQRWRVTFARALYSRAGILVLDDIFSAVDAHVGRQLFEEALIGELGKGRTRILVTHHLGLCLSRTAYAVSLNAGTVEYAGLVKELQQRGVLPQLRSEREELPTTQPIDIKDVVEALTKAGDEDENLRKIITTVTDCSVRTDDSEVDTRGKGQPKKFTEDENREKGSVKIGIWKEYLGTSGGWWFWPSIVLFFIFYQLLVLSRSWWISIWTRSYRTESMLVQQTQYYLQSLHGNPTQVHKSVETAHRQSNDDLTYYLGVYVGLSILICISGTWRYYLVFMASLKASRRLFDNLTYAILRAPLRWLDTVPVGRVLNRFTADFAVVDSRLGNDVGFMLYQVIQLVGIVIAGLFVSPYMLLSAVGLLIVCLLVGIRFLAGAREVKRLESNAKSPIFEQFGSALAGIGTIRAFAKVDDYVDRYVFFEVVPNTCGQASPLIVPRMFEKIDAHARTFWYIWLFNRWMAFRLNVVGAFFATLVAAVIVSTKGIDASLAGFALSFALQYSGAITYTIRQYTSVELAMNAMERIVEYSRIPIEKQEGAVVPAHWPTEGRLQVEGLVAGYAPDLPPVLKGLSFEVTRNQRIGVIGRTGAGKSSLTLALFRFLDAREGRIVIDGIDISKMTLHDLRSRLAIIPQDPVLFSGTVRSNLDTFDERGDAELHDALERVHLSRGSGSVSRGESTSAVGTGEPSSSEYSNVNTNIFASLSSRISEGGLNLSQGQRQLLCLARAIVSRPKIMVLDEATSAVDMATDVLIQRSIREEFEDSTLIVIAHRLSTIADFDRILVMSDGKAIEYDTPRNLLAKRGAFWEMVQQSGDKDRLEEIILGVNLGVKEGKV